MTIRKYLLVGAVAVASLLSAPAFAATQMLCAPDPSGAAVGPKRIVNTASTASPQPSYTLNSQGCAVIAQADIGFFLSQGFTAGSSEAQLLFTTGVATGTTDFVIGNVPAGYMITEIVFSNSVAAAVTGGISIGTTANGTDVVAAQAVGSLGLTFTTDALTLKRVFSTTVATPLHAAAVTAWNSANVTITVKMMAF
jgi:hypothetical protein